MKEDIEFLEKKLIEKHPNPFQYLKSEDFFAYTEELKTTKEKMSVYEFGMKLMILLSSMCDGHTGIAHSIGFLGSLNFPLEIEYMGDGYYVVSTSKEYVDIIGSQLLSINNLSMSEVERLLSPIISIENEVSLQHYIPKILTEPTILNYFGIVNGEEWVLELEKDSKKSSIVMPALDHRTSLIDISCCYQ